MVVIVLEIMQQILLHKIIARNASSVGSSLFGIDWLFNTSNFLIINKSTTMLSKTQNNQFDI